MQLQMLLAHIACVYLFNIVHDSSVATSLSWKILQYDGVPKNPLPPPQQGLPSQTTPEEPTLQHHSFSAVSRALTIFRLTSCEFILLYYVYLPTMYNIICIYIVPTFVVTFVRGPWPRVILYRRHAAVGFSTNFNRDGSNYVATSYIHRYIHNMLLTRGLWTFNVPKKTRDGTKNANIIISKLCKVNSTKYQFTINYIYDLKCTPK